jgi:hypothetical protein
MYSQLMKEKLNADDMKINQLTLLTKKVFIWDKFVVKKVALYCDLIRCDIIRVFRPAVNSSYLTLFFET